MTRTQLARFAATRLVLVLLILGAVEAAFRMGAWEGLAKKDSNAGHAVALRRNLEALGPQRLDYVTLGDSRAVYGLDHEAIAAAARQRGFVHASLAVPGMYWMSMRAITNWLGAKAPQVRGAVVALTPAHFTGMGNGSYELNLAAPFTREWDRSWTMAHVPFDRSDPATYGSLSSLFLYREDARDLLRHPHSRFREVRKARADPARLFRRFGMPRGICSHPIDSLARCMAATADPAVRAMCVHLKGISDGRVSAAAGKADPRLRSMAEQQKQIFRAMPFPRPIVVVLMPLPGVWTREVLPEGAERWAREVLQELQDEQVIEFHDFTRLFAAGDAAECDMFWDVYHQNDRGQAALTARVLPILEKSLYR